MVMAPRPMRETSRLPRRAFFMVYFLWVWFPAWKVGMTHMALARVLGSR